jgi:hypothetical protein
MNMLGFSSSVHFAHIACYCKFLLLHYAQVPWEYKLCRTDHAYLTQSQSHIATVGQSISKSWCRAPSGAHDQIFITLWQLRSWFCEAPSLTRGRVCLLYMLLALASVVFLRSDSVGTRDRILLSQIWDFLFVASYDSQGHGGGIRPRLHTGRPILLKSKSKSKLHCDWRSVNQ